MRFLLCRNRHLKDCRRSEFSVLSNCAGIVNTVRKTHQFADGSWANGSRIAVFGEYLNYDILWDPTPTQDSKNPPGFFDETFFSAPDFRTGKRLLSTLVGHYRTSQDIL